MLTNDVSSANTEYYTIKLPSARRNKPKCELWSTVNQTELETLIHCLDQEPPSNSYPQFTYLLSQQLGLDTNDIRDRLLADKYYYVVRFGHVEQGFSRQQVSALMSILRGVHRVAIDTVFGNLAETWDYFTELVLCYSVHRPPHSLALFTPQQSQAVVDYFLASYFKSFRAHKYAFTDSVCLDLQVAYNGLETPPKPDDNNIETNEFMKTDEIKEENCDDLKTTETENQDALREFVKAHLIEKVNKLKTEIIGEERLSPTNKSPSRKQSSSKLKKSK